MDRFKDRVASWQDGRRRSSQPTPNTREPLPDDSGPSTTSHGPDSNNNETADGRRAVSSAATPGVQGYQPRSASLTGPILRKPVPDRPNDSSHPSVSQSPESSSYGAGRGRPSVSSAAAAGIQGNRRRSSPLAAPIPRNTVPISDLISPLELEACEVSSVSPPPRLGTRRASHRGYGELHSAAAPVTEMTAVLEDTASNKSQSSPSEHHVKSQSNHRDSSGNDTPSGARGSLPPPPQTPDHPTQSTSDDANLHKRLPPLPASTPENLHPVPAFPHNFSYRSPVQTQPGDQASVSDLISLSSEKASPAENDIALEVTSSALEQAIPAEASTSDETRVIKTPKRSKYDYDGGSPSPSPAPKPQRSRFMSDPKQIADQIMAANHPDTPSGATSPQISSALGSRNPSGNSKQLGLRVPPSITAHRIQTALAESPEPLDDDDDRTPRALQPSRPIFPDPDSPTLRAYKTEPPRTGPGFNGRMGPMPPAGVPNRSQLWETPHRLSDDEMKEIIDQYNALFGLAEGTRDSFMPRAHRYPEHGRGEEARLRKLEFEQKTGETMSDEEYYSLFDHTTSTDGMLSTLLEWMQGRQWVKAPYVNRIIHQLGRMMYTSAQEEARLRQRRQLECDFLRRALEDCEKRCRSKRELSDQEKTRSAELRKIESSWNRVNDLSGGEEKHIRENMDKWADSEGAAARVEKSFQRWKALHDNLKDLLNERAQLENLITAGPCILSEDIGRLRDTDVGIQQHRGDFQSWMMDRTENLIEWLRVEGDDESSAKAMLNTIHDELIREEKILCGALDGLKQVADLQRSARELEAKSLIELGENLPEPTLPHLSQGSDDDNSLYAHPDGSNDYSDSSRVKFLNASSENTQILVAPENPDVTVDNLTPKVVRDRFDNSSVRHDCAGCRDRDELLREKDRTIQDQRHRLKDGYGKWAATQDTATKLYQALKSAKDGNIETALGHIERYRELVIRGWHGEMVHLENLFKTQVSRVDEQAALFKVPLDFLTRGGSPEVMAEDLEALGTSFRRLADSSLYVQQEFSRHLQEMVARHDVRGVTQQNFCDEESKDELIRELRKQIADLKKMSMGTREDDAQRSLRVSQVLEKHMKFEIDKVREKIKRCRKEIGKQQKQCEADQTSTTSNDPEMAAKLKRDEEQLRILENQCSKAEQMIERLKAELEKTKEAARTGDQIASDLNAEVALLQTQLEERDETGRWNLWDGTAVDVTDSSNPEIQRRNRAAQLQKSLLEAVVKVEIRTANQTVTKARVSSATKLKNLVISKTRRGGKKDSTETTEKEIEGFWRLVTFQRRRAEVVSHLRRNQFEHAKELLGHMMKDHGNWPVEYHGVEIRRSLHYLLAYAHARLAPIHRQSGVGVEITSKTLEDAKAHFAAAEKENEDAEQGQAWSALRVYLASEVKKTVDQLQAEKCECKHKTRVCETHQDNGVGVSYHNFMTIEGEEDVELELPQSALNSLDQYSRGPF